MKKIIALALALSITTLFAAPADIATDTKSVVKTEKKALVKKANVKKVHTKKAVVKKATKAKKVKKAKKSHVKKAHSKKVHTKKANTKPKVETKDTEDNTEAK